MNKVILIGRLTADPQINDRITCASFNLAVDRAYKKDGEQSADFISCKLLGEKKADFANHYLRKGVKIAVEGRIQTGSYTNKDGLKVYTTDIIVESTEFCESKNASGGNNQNSQNSSGFAGQRSGVGDGDFMRIPDNIDAELPFN